MIQNEKCGLCHPGIITFPVPILKGAPEQIKLSGISGSDLRGLLRSGSGLQDLRRIYGKNGTHFPGPVAVLWNRHLRLRQKSKQVDREPAAFTLTGRFLKYKKRVSQNHQIR